MHRKITVFLIKCFFKNHISGVTLDLLYEGVIINTSVEVMRLAKLPLSRSGTNQLQLRFMVVLSHKDFYLLFLGFNLY